MAMSQIRRVAPDWENPKDNDGNYEIRYTRQHAKIFVESGMINDYSQAMPDWATHEKTSYMFYNGNLPVSPVCHTIEDIANFMVGYIGKEYVGRECVARQLSNISTTNKDAINLLNDILNAPYIYDYWLLRISGYSDIDINISDELKMISEYLSNTDRAITYSNNTQLFLEHRIDQFPYGLRGTTITVEYYLVGYRVKHHCGDGQYVYLELHKEYFTKYELQLAESAYEYRFENEPNKIHFKDCTLTRLILNMLDKNIQNRDYRIHFECVSE